MSDSPRSDLHTSHTMFDRLRSPDEKSKQLAWEDFRDRYAPVVAGFARNLGASSQDVDDIIQDVFLRLLVAMPKFEYDPARGRFRGYLKVMTLNVIRSRMGQRARINTVPLSQLRDDEEPLEEHWSTIWEQHVLKRAIEVVRRAHAGSPRTFQAFEQYVILDHPAEEVARSLGMSVDSVYQAKLRITSAIRNAVKELKLTDE